MRRIRRDERGSIAVTMSVMTITTLVVAALLTEVHSGLHLSRRAGNSGNALQVADAGVNDAARQVATAALSASCPGSTAVCFTRAGSVGSGTYSYTATRNATNAAIWHVESVGTDKSGVKRRVIADVTGESQFRNPIYVNNTFSIGAGAVLDSYSSGLNVQTGCTRKGIIGMSDGQNTKFTSGGKGNSNCTGRVLGVNWDYAMDGCIVYGGATMPPRSQAECPDNSATVRVPTPFPVVEIKRDVTGSFTCSAATGANSLKGGQTYAVETLRLVNGCGIDPTTLGNGKVVVFAQNVTIGQSTGGTRSLVNAPTTATCSTWSPTWSYVDATNNPPVNYCGGWSSLLEINVVTGKAGTVSFNGSGTSFWGVIRAPDATVTLNAPQLELWGAMVAGSVNVKAQFSWHYDESLSQITTGRFSIVNWREEPLS